MFQPDWCSWLGRCQLMFLSSEWCSCGLQVPLLGCAGSHAQATPAEMPCLSVFGTLSQEHPTLHTWLLQSAWLVPDKVSLLSKLYDLDSFGSENVPVCHTQISNVLALLLVCDICHINFICHIFSAPLWHFGGNILTYLKHFGGSFWRPNVFQNGDQKLPCLLLIRMFYCSCP